MKRKRTYLNRENDTKSDKKRRKDGTSLNQRNRKTDIERVKARSRRENTRLR